MNHKVQGNMSHYSKEHALIWTKSMEPHCSLTVRPVVMGAGEGGLARLAGSVPEKLQTSIVEIS